jgi:hypothetical protein
MPGKGDPRLIECYDLCPRRAASRFAMARAVRHSCDTQRRGLRQPTHGPLRLGTTERWARLDRTPSEILLCTQAREVNRRCAFIRSLAEHF